MPGCLFSGSGQALRPCQWTKHGNFSLLLWLRNREKAADNLNIGFLAKIVRWWDGKDSGGNITDLSRVEKGPRWTRP